MKYRSTRGDVKGVSFKDLLLSGYASDGGMLLPESFPQVSTESLRSWAGLTYEQLAYEVISLFITEEDIPADDLKGVLQRAFSTFTVPDVVPLTHLADGLTVVELYHGRSLAFKDLAMSCMGQFYNYFLSKSKQHMNLVVCTSGDTGSSAIEAVRGMSQVDIMVILPRDRCTVIQERQMTTVLDSNVHVYRADGSSDDIDIVVRKLFADTSFVSTNNLGSPSSLNFARILIQLVHFFYTYLKLCPSADKEVELILPTGGGGNVTAGTITRKMGLPVRFVCAVNKNNILSRIMDDGQCELGEVEGTLAPAMDIQFAYNLERVWYLCSGEDGDAIKKIMAQVDNNQVRIPANILNEMKSFVKVYTVSGDEEIKTTISRCWRENQYNICPHTAVGVSYFYQKLSDGTNSSSPSAVLATASPLKFPEAIRASGVPAPTSEKIETVLSAPTRFVDLEKSQDWTEIVKQKMIEATKSYGC
ncbi:threonine synthase-like 2 [Aplysia californica]|uniref:Threonine synthase-like 2 n=1 Tax=Aplysia californica TaxID=6500 RepID=A0ABM0JFB1_APLCA|nr:threonine synthase-like 2 [Aplysia californica]XP_005092383.1 threonine synthase-like 2 [Aplysia californica]XP_035824088.1 threonine synthase-like 2 [Aplysia californica]